MKKFRSTPISSNNFVTYFLGHTKRCQGSTPKLSNMRSRLIQMLPVRQHLKVINPRKVPAIKVEVEKLLNVGFIYSVPLTEWVSNSILVNKKQGTIRVCMDFRDMNKACPKDNFPTPFIYQILYECVGSEVFSFMDGFSGYNQIQIKPKDQHNTMFIFSGVILHT